jgi:plastocyanin
MDVRSVSATAHASRRRWLGAAAGAALALAALAGPALAADESVGIADFAFAPDAVTVDVGDTVTWTNQDGVPHTATADGGAFDTGSLGQGQSGEATFDTPGTFTYHCAVHPTMTGTVVVQGAAAPSDEPTEPPAGATDAPTVTNPPTDATSPGADDGGFFGLGGLALVAGATAVAFGLGLVVRRRVAAR